MIQLALTGFVTLKVLDRSGAEVAREIDLFAVYNRLVDTGTEALKAGRYADAADERAAYLKGIGFDVSATAATLLVDLLALEVEAVQKKSLSNGSAGTADSTASRSGPTDPTGTPQA